MSAREDILGRIRAATAGVTAPAVPRDYRIFGDHASGDPRLLDLLTDRLDDYKATVHRVTAAELPGKLAEITLGWSVVVPPGSPLPLPGAAVDDDLAYADLDRIDAVLTGCAAACAETGTIALDGGPGQGRRALTLIPDRHVCVVLADQVVQTVPELLHRLDPARPLTFVSGPSATSDIELNRVEGVHGPRTLIVVLVTA
ncbi:LutC/YkgG family protein [Hamadaea tsunoensis]|uniref:LutC/YkgG family protein n=1 Tax=Hamadaea tsunoensis TaxID=53368 RepID=UPI000423DC5E|nr:LUD domain-containing protein [Hamadaea tsunoensis]